MLIDSQLTQDAISLLKKLIATPSFSREESGTAAILEEHFRERNIPYSKQDHNVWARNQFFNKELPTILLNSHHDTVKPNAGYTKNPHEPIEEDGKLYGLGSNDAGGPLVCLIAVFEHYYYRSDLSFNLVLAASAEEEVSGKNGIEALIPNLPKIDLAIVGEPTLLKIAVSEKGLMVIDAEVKGIAGHAAREEGENAIFKAIQDLEWFKNYEYPLVSDSLGKMKQSVTVCSAGTQHNVVPDLFKYTVDVRMTDAYTMEEVLQIIDQNTVASIKPRSTRLKPSGLPKGHYIYGIAENLKIDTYGSPTLSDQALMPFQSIKMGPGDSARSHSADEFIYLDEIKYGIEAYVALLKAIHKHFKNNDLEA
ncbi:acetylornithine deacetylase [Spirosomataceae bacterium TFI 002]|nr:acetylornithine deacetylase [Spirosomataceae bacterium TFI 002]